MTFPSYDARNWFWIINGDATQAWSSAFGAYVRTYPDDAVTHIESEDELSDILRPYGLTLPKPTQADYATAIQSHVDAIARARQYNDGATLAGYATDPNVDYASDASSFIAWRSAVWVYAHQLLGQVQAGQAPQPTIDGFIASLPNPPWPLGG